VDPALEFLCDRMARIQVKLSNLRVDLTDVIAARNSCSMPIWGHPRNVDRANSSVGKLGDCGRSITVGQTVIRAAIDCCP
jgi:hypothetical protein